jgi:predicted nucleotidyltransferase component of viral defense system
MNDSEKYYEEKLYPLQNGVLDIVQKAETPFFLTGGTALSRYYTHHRYSDDLDFFVINDSEYAEHVRIILHTLIEAENGGLFNLDRSSINKGKAYTQLFITATEKDEIELKIEFINDVAAHYGSITDDPILGRIDSLRNILSNKLTALFRSEPKDVVDIHAIALQQSFNWRKIVTEAKNKEVGADPEVIYDMLNSFPLKYLDTIKWITQPDIDTFKQDIQTIADDILYGRNNSLASKSAKKL